MSPLEKLGHEYLFSADKVRMRAKQLELQIKGNTLSEAQLINIFERIEMLKTQYRETKKIGEKLINYYNKQ